jgi:preprotein translocase subunit SecE
MSTKVSTKNKQVNSKAIVSARAPEANLKYNRLRWLLISLLFISGVIANIYYAVQPVSIRLAAWTGLIVVISIIAISTQQGQQAKHFIREAKMELRKVVWPSRQETTRTTMIVIAMVLVASLLLWGIDAVLMNLIGWLTGH